MSNSTTKFKLQGEVKMSKKVKITLVGGGSVNWSPKLINDLMLKEGLEKAEFILLDIDLPAAEKIAQLGKKINEERELSYTFEATNDEEAAFKDTDYVIITITTGGLDAMEYDLKIPEEYGIYQTVGDTAGPGGWARGLRNIPVFAKMAKKIEKLSPHAIVLNYTNPMATLTKTFYKVSKLSTVGLCHGVFETYRILMEIFNLKKEDEIKVNFGGTNHFFWVLDFKVKGEDGYKLLREKLKGRSLSELVKEIHKDEIGFQSRIQITSELLEHFGYLTYVDRHISEFFSYYLTLNEDRLKEYGLQRTSIKERREGKKRAEKRLQNFIKGKEKLSSKPSREIAANIISAMQMGKEFVDVVNLPNQGQIFNLPKGSVLETLGLINANGFHPVIVGELPLQILNLVLPHVQNQDVIVEAGLRGDWDKAFYALYNDPLCSHLSYPKIKEMGKKLLEANRKYLSQFFN